MALVRSSETLERIKSEFENGSAKKRLWSFHLPEYQRNILEMISGDSGDSMADIVRTELDEMIQTLIKRVEAK